MLSLRTYLTEPRKIIGALFLFITVFLSLIAYEVLTGTSSEDLDQASRELSELNAVNHTSDDTMLEQRTTRLTRATHVSDDVTADIERSVATKEFETLEDLYGREFRIVMESELTESDASTVIIEKQPVLHGRGVLPLSIQLDDKVHVFVEYDLDTGYIAPLYINRESEGE